MATLGRDYRDSHQQRSSSLSHNLCAHLILVSSLGYVLFDERFTIGVATGGRGALQPFDLWIPLVATLVLLGLGKIQGARLLTFQPRLLFWLPYTVFTVALPFLAVFVKSDPVRTMYTSIHGLIILGFIVLGSWAAFAGGTVLRLGRTYLWIAIIAEFLVSLIDYLNKTGMYRTPIGEFLAQWNVDSEGTIGEYTAVTWRCVGTYVNPNELGVWSVMAFWASTLLLRRVLRFSGILAALLTLILSESRGSMIALLGTFVIWLAYLALSSDISLRKARDATYLSAMCCCLAIGWGGAALSQSDGLTVSDHFSFITRFQRGLNVFSEGSRADPNAQARVNAWHRALDFYYDHPLGTWSSARMSFHLYIDNEYVKALVQGSLLYLLSLIFVLYGTVRRISCPSAASRFVAMISLTAALNGISAYPFTYPVIGMLWLGVGYDIAAQRLRSERSRRNAFAWHIVPIHLAAE